MQYLSDLLLTAAALGAAAYCFVLSRRLKALASLEGGMGTAIAMLSAQVDDLSRSLKAAQETAGRTGGRLEGQTARAEAVARKLDLLLASMHDLTEDPPAPAPAAAAPRAAGPRAPSPWPAEAGRRTAPAAQRAPAPAAFAPAPFPPAASPDDDDGPAHEPAARTRVLRRRQAVGQEFGGE